MGLSISTWAPKPKHKRKAPPNTPVHNYADTAEAIVAMAVIIDPDAFEHSDEVVRMMTTQARQRLAQRRGVAMQKARECAAAYDYHLGNQRNVTVVVREAGHTRYFKVKRGEGAKKKAETGTNRHLGGLARAKNLSPERRKEIAMKAAAIRWGNKI